MLFALLAAALVQPAPAPNFKRTQALVPMRDGVRLNTVVLAPEVAADKLPILIQRTPYGVAGAGVNLARSPEYKELVADGYMFVFQDIRGRYDSEGQFVMSRPPRDPTDPKAVDEASDTRDTIDWLLANVPGHNGRVGIFGISYPGWLAAEAALDPHPALKAASPQANPADQFLGDDFHHNGAFRLSYGFEYTVLTEQGKTNQDFKFDTKDAYEWFLKLGPLSNVNARHFKGKLPTWNDFVAHPNYDAFWKRQAVEPRATRVAVPTLTVGGWYDQEDFRGPLKLYEGLEKHDTANQNFLVVGPWNHGGWSGRGDRLGAIPWGSDTGAYFRREVQAPFFAHHLKGKGKQPLPEALMFQTGANKWVRHDTWPPKDVATRSLYFHPDGKLAFTPPTAAARPFDAYTSDPANPVPYRPRPINPTYQGPGWSTWMLQDQRFTHRRPDVLSYESEPLTEDLVVAGSQTAKLFASTSGSDCDWVVRLIDVYPEDYPDRALAGYQLLITGEPVRARWRNGFETPEPVTPGHVEGYTVDLHWGHHRFRKGHRVMVQVSSTWFPLIDRNPQRFVPNIFEAKAEDFGAAKQRVYHTPRFPSRVELQTMPAD